MQITMHDYEFKNKCEFQIMQRVTLIIKEANVILSPLIINLLSVLFL